MNVSLHHLQAVARGFARRAFGWRMAIFIALLAGLWSPGALGIYRLLNDPNGQGIALMVWLLVVFLGTLTLWGRWVYGCPTGLRRYGLAWNGQTLRGMGVGLALGGVALVGLFGIQAGLGWLTWQFAGHSGNEPSMGTPWLSLMRVALEGGLVAIAIGFGEELVFRGWLLSELEHDYAPSVALWASSLVFAVLHFIKPMSEIVRTFPQFPGLVLLGLTLVWARRSHHGNLGLAIGLHAGLVGAYYLVEVGQLITYAPSTPELWSGIDHNPLAGGLGLLMLSILAIGMRQRAQTQPPSSLSGLPKP